MPVFPHCERDADINEHARSWKEKRKENALFAERKLTVRLLPRESGTGVGNKFKILQVVSFFGIFVAACGLLGC